MILIGLRKGGINLSLSMVVEISDKIDYRTFVPCFFRNRLGRVNRLTSV